MIIEFQINENDFLTHQLFVASKSERINKKRQRSKILGPVIYLVFGLLFILQEEYSLAISFWILAILWFFIYPIWERRHYIKHYTGAIKENHKDSFGRTITMEFNNEYFIGKDKGSESKVSTTELEEINEISTVIFVRIKGGQSFILPKERIGEIDKVKASLKDLARHLNIPYHIEENWEWK
jgi:hypothetical protein